MLPPRPDAFFTFRFPQYPDGKQYAHFFYEAECQRTNSKGFTKKLRAHFHFVAKRLQHQEDYNIGRIRAVHVEIVDRECAERLRQAAEHPNVCGSKPTPLFWFTPSDFSRSAKG